MQGNCCNWTACLGRTLLGLFVVIMAALNFMHPEANLVVLTAHHVPSPDLIFKAWLVLHAILGLMLIIGRGTRTAAWILIVLTIVSLGTFVDFWNQVEPVKSLMMVFFLHGVAVIAALLLVAAHKKHCE